MNSVTQKPPNRILKGRSQLVRVGNKQHRVVTACLGIHLPSREGCWSVSGSRCNRVCLNHADMVFDIQDASPGSLCWRLGGVPSVLEPPAPGPGHPPAGPQDRTEVQPSHRQVDRSAEQEQTLGRVAPLGAEPPHTNSTPFQNRSICRTHCHNIRIKHEIYFG